MDYQPKKKKNEPANLQSRRRWIIIIAAFILLAGVGLVSVISAFFFVNNDFLDANTIDVEGAEAVEYIERALQVTLPESASNRHFYYTSWLDYYMQIRIDLPSDGVPAFLESIQHMCFDNPLDANPIVYGKSESSQTWWRPDAADHLIGTEQCGDNPYWKLMIDQSSDDIWIMYIMSFST